MPEQSLSADSVSWRRLPPYHVSRPRLTDRCAAERIVVVEAAAGYGKSVFAAELVEAWGVVPVWVLLEEGGVPAPLLVARLRAGAARAGLWDAARALDAAGVDDPAGAVDRLVEAATGEACAFVFDDADHADDAAAGLLVRIAAQLASPQRLVVLARVLPPGLQRLRRADAQHLNAADLALRAEETAELCRIGFGLDVSDDDVDRLAAATGGWTAAAVLAAARAQRTETPFGDLTSASHAEALDAVLDEALSALGSQRELAAQIASLPLVDRDLFGQVAGDAGLFDRALAAGLPVTPAHGRWWELPRPVRERLQQVAHPERDVFRAAASHYEGRGELGLALQMLLAARLPDEAARLLATADLRTIETVDVLELLAVLDRIPTGVLDEFPLAALHVARACGAVLLQQRERLLARLDASVDALQSPALRRAVDAELLMDSINGGSPARAEVPARTIVEATGADELLTRARALNVLGLACYHRRESDGRASEAAVREAADHLRRSAEIYRGLGYDLAASGLAPHRAIWIELGLGRPEAALEILNEGLALAAGHPRRFARILFFRAQVLTELGRDEDAVADLDEVLRISRRHADSMLTAYVDWQLMIIASLRGDSTAAVEHAHRVEAQRGDWWDVASAHFYADAADSLDRVGETALATEYLARAREDPQDAQRLIAMAECALEARHGDPLLAEERLLVIQRTGILPREHWRVTLLRARAALRRGDPTAGALAARAFEEAARLGQREAPLLREREVTESLLALAVETNLPAALALAATSLPVVVAVLGRFEVTRGGKPIELGSGQGAQLLKLVAASGGAVHSEQAIEALWPEVPPSVGKNRLRTVLNRLRDAAGDVISRDGEVLVLGPDVRLDLAEFRREARQAFALGRADAAVAVARSAIARYRGELLPHDLYEPWSDEPRESALRTMLELLDLCATAALERGDLDEARRIVDRIVELAPLDRDRYLKVASMLATQGRKGAALSVLRRVRSALAKVEIEPPHELVALEQSL